MVTLNRANQIQFFRFIAFMLIFYYHAPMFDFGILNYNNEIEIGMFFFFCLTGVVSAYSLYTKRDEPVTVQMIIRYAGKKFLKFYPLYFLTNLYTVSYSGLAQYVSNHDFVNILRETVILLKDLTMVRAIIPWELFSHNGVTWYLSTIVFLSILNLPLNNKFGRIVDNNHAVLKLMLISVVGLLYNIIIHAFFFFLGFDDIAVTNPIMYLGTYVTGMAVGYLSILFMQKYPSNVYQSKGKFTIYELLVFALWILSIFQKKMVFTLLGYVVTLFLIFVFMVGYGRVSYLLKSKCLVHLGDISYECFMVHQIVIHEYCQNNGWENYNRSGKLFSFVFCMAISVVIAETLHRITHLYART